MLEIHAKIDPNKPYHSFSVSRDGNYFMLKFPDGSLFAQLNEALATGLGSLENLTSVEIIAYAATKSIQHILSRAKTPGAAKLKADVNVYGAIDDANAVGDRLSLAKVFLQDPEHGIENVEYLNPHLIQFPGFEPPSTTTAHHDLGGLDSLIQPKDVQQEQESFNYTLSTIYQFLRRSRNLQGIRGSAHLLTALLPYAAYLPCLRQCGSLKLTVTTVTKKQRWLS